MISRKFLFLIAAATVALTSCNNDDLTIGQSLTDSTDKLSVTTATFPVTTRTVKVDSVIARTSDYYFGPETGAYITSDFMSQFHILETFELVKEDSIVSKENGQVVADSCQILVYLKSPSSFCDSLAAMKMKVTELASPVEENQEFYSNFDPEKLGYLRSDGLQKSKMFSWTGKSPSRYCVKNSWTAKPSWNSLSGRPVRRPA